MPPPAAAVVETPHGPITVGTTHLSFVPGWNGKQLRTFAADLRRLPGPRVLLGDLNMPPPFPRLLSRWRPLARAATYPADEPRIQLDHVLVDACAMHLVTNPARFDGRQVVDMRYKSNDRGYVPSARTASMFP